MSGTFEKEIFASVIGKAIDLGKISEIANTTKQSSGSYADCREIQITLSDNTVRKYLKITPAMKEMWRRNTIVLTIHIYEKNGIIIGGHVQKTIQRNKDLPSYETDPFQKELKLVQRCLQYVLSE